MTRYFLELSYKGTAYCGFQIQETDATIQSELTKALEIIFREPFQLTGSSRTDAGVHAMQNYFHCDTAVLLSSRHIYSINALLPKDIAVRSITAVAPEAHARFHAIHRSYRYSIYRFKDPFLVETAWLYPFPISVQLLQEAAAILMEYTDFTSFAKRNSQVKTNNCHIMYSRWIEQDGLLIYEVRSNRFLRGMIRGLVATMLKVGKGAISLAEFRSIVAAKDAARADFSAPAHGLCLMEVNYPMELLQKK